MCQKRPQYLITAVDLAQSMLTVAQSNIEAAELNQRIRLERIDTKRMPYPDLEFDMVISNSLAHHLPEPLAFLREVKRLIKPGGAILIRDLIRPDDDTIVDSLVAKIGDNYDLHQQQLFRDSLKAALTLAEVQASIDLIGLAGVKVYQSSELHWSIERRKS